MPDRVPGRKPPRLDKGARRDLTRRLRAALTERPLELAEMGAALEAGPEQVLVALRRLGKRKRGRLRSGVVDGRSCWWWEPPPAPPPGPAPSGGVLTPPAAGGTP